MALHSASALPQRSWMWRPVGEGSRQRSERSHRPGAVGSAPARTLPIQRLSMQVIRVVASYEYLRVRNGGDALRGASMSELVPYGLITDRPTTFNSGPAWNVPY